MFLFVLQFICIIMKEQENKERGMRKEFHCFCLVENDAILMDCTERHAKKI